MVEGVPEWQLRHAFGTRSGQRPYHTRPRHEHLLEGARALLNCGDGMLSEESFLGL